MPGQYSRPSLAEQEPVGQLEVSPKRMDGWIAECHTTPRAPNQTRQSQTKPKQKMRGAQRLMGACVWWGEGGPGLAPRLRQGGTRLGQAVHCNAWRARAPRKRQESRPGPQREEEGEKEARSSPSITDPSEPAFRLSVNQGVANQCAVLRVHRTLPRDSVVTGVRYHSWDTT